MATVPRYSRVALMTAGAIIGFVLFYMPSFWGKHNEPPNMTLYTLLSAFVGAPVGMLIGLLFDKSLPLLGKRSGGAIIAWTILSLVLGRIGSAAIEIYTFRNAVPAIDSGLRSLLLSALFFALLMRIPTASPNYAVEDRRGAPAGTGVSASFLVFGAILLAIGLFFFALSLKSTELVIWMFMGMLLGAFGAVLMLCGWLIKPR